MKKLRNKKNFVIIILSLIIIFIGIAFVFLAIRLNNMQNKKDFYEVKISSVEKGTIISDSKKDIKTKHFITDNYKTVKFNIKLNNIKDLVSYKVNIKNTGTMDAKIDNIIQRSSYKNNNLLSVKHNDIIGEVLTPGEEITLDITFSSPKEDLLLTEFIYEITVLTSNIN